MITVGGDATCCCYRDHRGRCMLIGVLSFIAGAAIGGYVGYAIGVNKMHKLVNRVAAAGDWHRQSNRPSD
jgi:hypothetical protein